MGKNRGDILKIRTTLFLLLFINCICGANSIFTTLPPEINIHIFEYVLGTKNKFYQLQQLLKLTHVNTEFEAYAKTIFAQQLSREDASILQSHKQYYPRGTINLPAYMSYESFKENLFFATAIRDNHMFWLFHYLKDEVRRNSKINEQLYNNLYPLHVAALYNAKYAARLLLNAGANAVQTDLSLREIPVLLAIKNNQNGIAKVLIKTEWMTQSGKKLDDLKACAGFHGNTILVEYIQKLQDQVKLSN